MKLGPIIFCMCCGFYSGDVATGLARTHRLAKRCSGRPPVGEQMRVLRRRRLLAGLHPVTGVTVGVPSVVCWRATQRLAFHDLAPGRLADAIVIADGAPAESPIAGEHFSRAAMVGPVRVVNTGPEPHDVSPSRVASPGPARVMGSGPEALQG